MLQNDQSRMTNEVPITNDEPTGNGGAVQEVWDLEAEPGLTEEPGEYRVYDLEERTTRFAEAVIDFLKPIPTGPKTNRIIDQLLGASSSIGANYCEADDSLTTKEFRQKLAISRRESRESKLFLRLLARAHEPCRPVARTLWREARELNLIFSAILRRTDPKSKG